MKNIIKVFAVIALAGILSLTFSSCANMHMHSNAGVNVNFGPGGPHVDPYLNVGFSGGRYY